ncbi:MAG: hypothetical protein AAF264_08190, partial [Pseudomonadota bacterium]
ECEILLWHNFPVEFDALKLPIGRWRVADDWSRPIRRPLDSFSAGGRDFGAERHSSAARSIGSDTRYCAGMHSSPLRRPFAFAVVLVSV